MKDMLPHSYKTLTLDIARYQSRLDSTQMSPADREAFLTALWNMIVAFVDLGFEVRAQENCGQFGAGATTPLDLLINSDGDSITTNSSTTTTTTGGADV